MIYAISVRECVFSLLRGWAVGIIASVSLNLVGKATEGRQKITEVWFPCRRRVYTANLL